MEHTAEIDAGGPGCTVNLLGGTCPVRDLCRVHGCTEEWCHCEDEPPRILPPGAQAYRSDTEQHARHTSSGQSAHPHE